MGGFTLVDPDLRTASPKDQNGQVLTVDRFKELIERSDFDLPDITEEDIEDRSKGDVLFKLIAILQTSWFIIQCIARGQQQLGLTELELVTLALASLNAVTFAIWWHKPLGVQKLVKIYLKIEARIVEDVASVDDLQRDRSVDLSFGDVIKRGVGKLSVSKNFYLTPLTFSEILAKMVPSLPSSTCLSPSPSSSLTSSASRSLSCFHSASSCSSRSSKLNQFLQKHPKIAVSLPLEWSSP